MYVKIGPYKNTLTVSTIAEKILFWRDPDSPEVDRLADFLMYGGPAPKRNRKRLMDSIREEDFTWFFKLLRWFNGKVPERTVKVRIDRWDTWSMDHTLGLIILPMLKQLNETKHGAPFTDDADVPEELRSTSAPPKENDWDTDELHFARWDWIMSEMIWAFEQHNQDWESQFHTGEGDMEFVPVDDQGREVAEDDPAKNGYLLQDSADSTRKFDFEGYKAHQARIVRGFTLFGKYFQNLWD